MLKEIKNADSSGAGAAKWGIVPQADLGELGEFQPPKGLFLRLDQLGEPHLLRAALSTDPKGAVIFPWLEEQGKVKVPLKTSLLC